MSVHVPDEADGFLAAHPRMHGVFHRTGLGAGPTHVDVVDTGLVRTTSTHFGFPADGSLELRPGYVGCGVIARSPRPLRWRGDEGGAGEAVVFTGGIGVPVCLPDRTTVRTMSAPADAVRSVADDLGRPIVDEAVGIVAGPSVANVIRAIRLHQQSSDPDREDADIDDELLSAFVGVLAAPAPAGTSMSIATSARIVADVIDRLASEDRWRMSTVQMCRTAHVSERRLQMAFGQMYGVGPAAFLRRRALAACRSALLAGHPSDTKVSHVAVDHGFHHLPRFASAYRAAFGELPSQTLSRRH
jgi:AraC-like DNA-binding protein